MTYFGSRCVAGVEGGTPRGWRVDVGKTPAALALEETEVKTEENEEPQRSEEEEEGVEPNEILTDLDEAGVEALASGERETILGLKRRDKGKEERRGRRGRRTCCRIELGYHHL